MVRRNQNYQSIKNLFDRLPSNSEYPSETLNVASAFQRGDEDNGVWTKDAKNNFIDSLEKDYPTGLLIFIRHRIVMGECWYTLDGGNRLRAMRDFKLDKLKKKFSTLTPHEQAAFDNINQSCEWIDIEREDPPGTVADMFTRLNTSCRTLSNGELYKAMGWMGNYCEIEMAKALIGASSWNTQFSNTHVSAINARWNNICGCLSETNRCNNITIMIGHIISAKTGDINNFDTSYKKNCNKLAPPGTNLTQDEIYNICCKFNKFMDMLESIGDTKIFGKRERGIHPKKHIAPLWGYVISDRDTPSYDKVIQFYRQMGRADTSARRLHMGYSAIIDASGDNHTTHKKIDLVLNFIHKADSRGWSV